MVASALSNNIFFWIAGELPMGTFDIIRLTDAIYIVFFFAFYAYLKATAARSFDEFVPVLEIDEKEAAVLRYRLTALPAPTGRMAIVAGFGLAVFAIQTSPLDFGITDTAPNGILVYQTFFSTISFAGLTALILQSLRQLNRVRLLHQRAAEIDLFHLDPIHAFSKLTARTGAGLILFLLFNTIQEPTEISEIDVISVLLIGSVAVGVFLIPLVGMRARLAKVKSELLNGINQRIKDVTYDIHHAIDSNNLHDLDDLNTALNSLITERDFIKKISTWPWDPNTLRGFGSAVFLPIVLWVVTRLLGRLL
jgi:hypothetical protein